MKKSILILGGSTHLNRGDHAMLHGIISSLAHQYKDDELILYAADPATSKVRYEIASRPYPDQYFRATLPRSRLKYLLKGFLLVCDYLWFRLTGRSYISQDGIKDYYQELERARCVVIHGSGSFNSLWWFSWLYPKTFLIILARIGKVPTVMTSQGIGPLDNSLDTMVAKVFFKFCQFIGTRDKKSLARIAAISKTGVKQSVFSGDDALLMKEQDLPNRVTTTLKNIKKPCIGVNLRDSTAYRDDHHTPNYIRYAEILDSLVDKWDCNLIFIPISYNATDDDRVSSNTVVSNMRNRDHAYVVEDELNAAQLRSIIQEMDCALGTSYHFLLFSLDGSVPSAGIYQDKYYELKVNGVLDLYGLQEFALDARSATSADITAAIDKLMVDSVRIAHELRSRSSALREECGQSRRMMLDVISSHDNLH